MINSINNLITFLKKKCKPNNELSEFRNKVIVITGSTGGIGSYVALELGKGGSRLCLTTLQQEIKQIKYPPS
jgi:hypothetical protein